MHIWIVSIVAVFYIVALFVENMLHTPQVKKRVKLLRVLILFSAAIIFSMLTVFYFSIENMACAILFKVLWTIDTIVLVRWSRWVAKTTR